MLSNKNVLRTDLGLYVAVTKGDSTAASTLPTPDDDGARLVRIQRCMAWQGLAQLHHIEKKTKGTVNLVMVKASEDCQEMAQIFYMFYIFL